VAQAAQHLRDQTIERAAPGCRAFVFGAPFKKSEAVSTQIKHKRICRGQDRFDLSGLD